MAKPEQAAADQTTVDRRETIVAPKGIVFSDLDWVDRVAKRYMLWHLELAAGSVVLERLASTGGRCFCYPDGSWLIGLSLPRFQLLGRRGMEGILAHELLHAWLWSHHNYAGHGPVFAGHASVRGIPRWCPAEHGTAQSGPHQLPLFDREPLQSAGHLQYPL